MTFLRITEVSRSAPRLSPGEISGPRAGLTLRRAEMARGNALSNPWLRTESAGMVSPSGQPNLLVICFSRVNCGRDAKRSMTRSIAGPAPNCEWTESASRIQCTLLAAVPLLPTVELAAVRSLWRETFQGRHRGCVTPDGSMRALTQSYCEQVRYFLGRSVVNRPLPVN
jgi:hypothetical protein